MRRYRYIYLPPQKPPYLGQGYTIWYKYHTVPQLNKIRILFNSPSFYTHIYPYTTAYHCISCIYKAVYPIHLPLRPDYHAMHKRIQARIRSTVYAVYTHKRRSTDEPCKAKPRKSADTGRSSTRLIWYKTPSSYPLRPKKSLP